MTDETNEVLSEDNHYDGALTAKLFSKNKFDSDPVVHLQKFENAISELWEYVHSLK